jgi:hypothetical protein
VFFKHIIILSLAKIEGNVKRFFYRFLLKESGGKKVFAAAR